MIASEKGFLTFDNLPPAHAQGDLTQFHKFNKQNFISRHLAEFELNVAKNFYESFGNIICLHYQGCRIYAVSSIISSINLCSNKVEGNWLFLRCTQYT